MPLTVMSRCASAVGETTSPLRSPSTDGPPEIRWKPSQPSATRTAASTSQPTRRIGRCGRCGRQPPLARAPPPAPQLADAAQRRAVVRDPAIVGTIVDGVELDAARVGPPHGRRGPGEAAAGSGERRTGRRDRLPLGRLRGARCCGSRTRQRRLSGDGTSCFARGLHGGPQPVEEVATRYSRWDGPGEGWLAGDGRDGRRTPHERRETAPGAATRFLRMQPSDISGIVSAGAPVVSPDGSVVAFVVGRVDQPANRYRSQIWVAAASGEVPARPLSAGEKGDGSPVWAPDGRSLAFTSHRGEKDEETTIHVIPVDGAGETRTIAAMKGGVDHLVLVAGRAAPRLRLPHARQPLRRGGPGQAAGPGRSPTSSPASTARAGSTTGPATSTSSRPTGPRRRGT